MKNNLIILQFQLISEFMRIQVEKMRQIAPLNKTLRTKRNKIQFIKNYKRRRLPYLHILF